MSDEPPLLIRPRYLSRKQAAHYVGVSVDTFNQEVALGEWPKPRLRGAKEGKATCDIKLLDLAADLHSGLVPSVQVAPPPPPPAAEVPQQEAKRTVRRGRRSKVTG